MFLCMFVNVYVLFNVVFLVAAKTPQAAGVAAGAGGAGGAGGGAALSDADAELQARLDNLRRE